MQLATKSEQSSKTNEEPRLYKFEEPKYQVQSKINLKLVGSKVKATGKNWLCLSIMAT